MELLKFQSHFGPIVSGHVATHKLPKSFQHFLILTMSSKLSPKDQLNQLSLKLNRLINKLPTALPCGSKDSPLAKYLISLEYDKDSPYETFNMAWE